MRGYTSALEHTDEALGLIGQLIERQVRAHWELGILPPVKDEFSGSFVSSDEVSALLRGGNAPSEGGKEAIAALEKSIASRTARIEEKLAACREDGRPIPFDQLRIRLGLTTTEERVLWVLIAADLDSRLRQLLRYLVNESSRVHTDVGLLEMLVYSSPATRPLLVRELAPDAKLFRFRLVEHVGSRRQIDDAPYLLRPLRPARRVVEMVSGYSRLDPEVADVATLLLAPPALEPLVMADEKKERAARMLESALAAPRPAIVFAGKEGAGRRSLALGAAHRHGHAALLISSAELPTQKQDLERLTQAILREAILWDAVPIFVDIDSLAANAELGFPDRVGPIDRLLAGFGGPIMGTCARRDSRPVALSRGLVMVDVDQPDEAERSILWRRALGADAGDLDIALVAARYPITGGVVLRAADASLALARARGTGSITADDIHVGLRSALASKLAGLGMRISWRQTWDDLVLPEDRIAEIREFIARIRHRRRVYDEWGFGRKMAKGFGLSALFAGPPGTGKTMVAGIIAEELALDLYQIDLSRIVSKYVGETEKNLAQLFDAAEAGHAVLLFDEADSLFAKRTEVKSSVDRYANLEVNYLLQRMEAFNGITILTTNLDSSIDDAFRRRISFRVDFPFPEPEERIKLWEAMLPTAASVGADIDFENLADRYEMTGGYIRNAVLRAAFLAADEEQPISMRHMLRAANLEYQAMGKVISSIT